MDNTARLVSTPMLWVIGLLLLIPLAATGAALTVNPTDPYYQLGLYIGTYSKIRCKRLRLNT